MGPFKVLDYRMFDSPLEFTFANLHHLHDFLVTSFTLGDGNDTSAISAASKIMQVINDTRTSAADGVHQRLLDEVIALLAEASIDVQVLPTEE